MLKVKRGFGFRMLQFEKIPHDLYLDIGMAKPNRYDSRLYCIWQQRSVSVCIVILIECQRLQAVIFQQNMV